MKVAIVIVLIALFALAAAQRGYGRRGDSERRDRKWEESPRRWGRERQWGRERPSSRPMRRQPRREEDVEADIAPLLFARTFLKAFKPRPAYDDAEESDSEKRFSRKLARFCKRNPSSALCEKAQEQQEAPAESDFVEADDVKPKKNSTRPVRPGKPKNSTRPARPERPQRPGRPVRPARNSTRPARPERPVKPVRPGRIPRPARNATRPARPIRPVRPVRPARNATRTAKPERPQRGGRIQKITREDMKSFVKVVRAMKQLRQTKQQDRPVRRPRDEKRVASRIPIVKKQEKLATKDEFEADKINWDKVMEWFGKGKQIYDLIKNRDDFDEEADAEFFKKIGSWLKKNLNPENIQKGLEIYRTIKGGDDMEESDAEFFKKIGKALGKVGGIAKKGFDIYQQYGGLLRI